MPIHHSTIKQAEKKGVMLQEEAGLFSAYVPKWGVKVFEVSAKAALAQMEALVKLFAHAEGSPDIISTKWMLCSGDITHGWLVLEHKGADPVVVRLAPMKPHDLEQECQHPEWGYSLEAEASWADVKNEAPTLEDAGVVDPPKGAKNGVPTHGGEAHKAGFMTPDCPFDEDSDEEEQWINEWEESADEADAAAAEVEEEEGKRSGTVVAEKYRQKYKELGHPENCGDWLNNQLDARIKNKAGTNLELLDLIMDANGVKNTAKLGKPSDKGRYRMTGRVILARRIFLEGGKFVMPEQMGGEVLQAPADWMAVQKFKPKKEA